MALLLAVDLFNLGPGKGEEGEFALNLISLASAYAWRSALGVAAFLICKPWRYYEPLRRSNLLPAFGLGVGIFILWIGLESETVRRVLPGLSRAYETWAVLPFGELREVIAPGESPFHPALCGWPLTLVRLAGSAFVIAVIEEFFWRGYLYRWAQSLDFLDVDPGRLDGRALLIVSGVFAAVHHEWLAALITGLAYGYFYIRTRDVWATALAHVITNLLLGVYILLTGHYHFW